MAYIFLWKKSIQNTNGRCPVCGCAVANHGRPTDNVEFSPSCMDKGALWCISCQREGRATILGRYIETDEKTISKLKHMDGMDLSDAERELDRVAQKAAEQVENDQAERTEYNLLKSENLALKNQVALLEGNIKHLKQAEERQRKLYEERNEGLQREIRKLNDRINELMEMLS